MTETAKMYGGSLYDLAAEEGLETRILGELDEVQQLLKQNPDYLRLLSTPSIPKKERCGLLDEALRGQVHLYVLNFLKILCEKGTLRELSGCARAYRIRYNQAHGILEATAISAVPLTEQQRAALHAKLESLTGKTIEEARNEVKGLNLSIRTIEQASEQPAGTVLSQSPDAGSTVRKSSVITLVVSTGVPEVVATPEPRRPTVNEDGTITVQESWWPSADGSHQIHQLTDGTMWNENGQRCDAQGNPIA